MYHDHYNIDKLGKIGPVLQSHYYFPKDPKKSQDVEAADKILQFWVSLKTICSCSIWNSVVLLVHSSVNMPIQYSVKQAAIQK